MEITQITELANMGIMENESEASRAQWALIVIRMRMSPRTK